MKALHTLLRLLVLAGAVLWLTHPRTATYATTYSCVSYSTTQRTCPSGCTDTTYPIYTVAGAGEYDIIPVTAPCGAAKPGQQCIQPSGGNRVQYDSTCCHEAGEECFNVHCCDGLDCGNVLGDKVCCLPADQGPCEQDSDCCTLKCNPDIHVCVYY